MQLLSQKIKMDFYRFFSLTFVQFEEADEDKKFINPKRCIREKFHLQKAGVTKVFFLVKVESDFDFGHLVGKLLGKNLSSGHNQ